MLAALIVIGAAVARILQKRGRSESLPESTPPPEAADLEGCGGRVRWSADRPDGQAYREGGADQAFGCTLLERRALDGRHHGYCRHAGRSSRIRERGGQFGSYVLVLLS